MAKGLTRAATVLELLAKEPRSIGDKHRQRFEAWISAPPYERKLDRHRQTHAWPGQYVDYEVQLAWEAWETAVTTVEHPC